MQRFELLNLSDRVKRTVNKKGLEGTETEGPQVFTEVLLIGRII